MPLDKRNISISFGQGVDTKTDPNQVMAGKLLQLNNAVLTETLLVQKRNGYQSLFQQPISSSAFPLNAKLAPFNSQLLLMDGSNFNFIEQTGFPKTIDSFTGTQPTVAPINRDPSGSICPDSAYNSFANNFLYTWASSTIFGAPNLSNAVLSNGKPYQTFIIGPQNRASYACANSNSDILFSGQIAGLSRPTCYSVGNNYFILGTSLSSSSLNYFYFPAIATSATMSSGIIGVVGPHQSSSANPLAFLTVFEKYDAAVLNNNLMVSWFSRPTSSIFTTQINQNGVIASTSQINSTDASGALGVFGDTNNYWLCYSDGVTKILNYAVISTSGNVVQYGPYNVITTAAPINSGVGSAGPSSGDTMQITGTTQGSTSAFIYFGTYSSYPTATSGTDNGNYSGASFPTRTDFITKQVVTLSGAALFPSSTLIRSVEIASKAFQYNNNDYFLIAYGANSNHNRSGQPTVGNDRLEPTYFLYSPTQSNAVVGKIAYQNGGGYDFPDPNASDLKLPLPKFNQINSQSFQTTNLFKISPRLTILSDIFVVAGLYGVNSTKFEFGSLNTNQSVTLQNSLNIAGGFLTNYDGVSLNEQNFHLFPEDVQFIPGIDINNILAAASYSYAVTYQSTDKFGNTQTSTPSKPYFFPLVAPSSGPIQVIVPTLRVTNKKNVVIKVYRTAPSIDTTTLYDIAPFAIFPNDPTVDNIVINDSLADTKLIANPVLYTTGGVIPDNGAPSPYAIAQYKDRLFIVDSENRNNLWYSKEVIAGTSVEMSSLQIIQINRRLGNVNAIIEMDDKLIVHIGNDIEGGIYYITGNGPDATGNNNDFSDPIFITSTVYTQNQRSIVVTPDGVMFQSNKGIWLLDRSLGTSYIGAPVEAFNSATITSATVIPNTTQVRFTLDSGFVLVWDYFQKQWSVFTSINANHAIIYQGLFTYLQKANSPANILQETLGLCSDNGSPILMGLQTSWLSVSGLQGYQRAYKLYVMGHYISPHLLNVSVAYDFNPGAFQTAQIKPSASGNRTYGGYPLYGASNMYGGSSQFQQNRMNLTQQKCQSIQITIQESIDPLNFQLGAGVQLENIGLVIGTKLSYPKIPARLSVK